MTEEKALRRPRRPLPARTSEVLSDIADDEGERITFRDILIGLRHRAFGFAILVFALPCCVPMPPGIPTVCGAALLIIASNLIAARRRLWLPRIIADKSVARADLKRLIERTLPHLRRLERFCRPRLAAVTDKAGKVVIGVVLLLLAVLMILPIPFLGNMPPGVAASVIAIGLTERDGIVVLIGLVLAVVAIAVVVFATWATIAGVLGLVTG